MLGLLAQQLGVEHLVAQEDQGYDLYHAEEVLLPHAHTEHLYYYPSASLNYIARAQSSWLGEGIGEAVGGGKARAEDYWLGRWRISHNLCWQGCISSNDDVLLL